ncbi:MAG TPA: UBP-type zinc finger domain-containing protein [Candidatus Limnocylindrales bacterium]|nr:UBP-type zinc finger domain-containing protein [Candidatus Limnocylindrales bacterium]
MREEIRPLLPAALHRAACEHEPATTAAPLSDVCQECGSDFSLRLCAECGHVGCCESQSGHARAHALRAGHPVILSVPAGEGFTWCYAEGRYTA